MESKTILRDIKIDIINGKYKAISAYKIPNKVEEWLNCPNCGLKPLIWEFNNGSSTACGCGENEYRNFSIYAESVMSYINRNNGSLLGYDSNALKNNWNHWVKTGEELLPHKKLRYLDRW